jgi:hypothetical protein
VRINLTWNSLWCTFAKELESKKREAAMMHTLSNFTRASVKLFRVSAVSHADSGSWSVDVCSLDLSTACSCYYQGDHQIPHLHSEERYMHYTSSHVS